MQKEERFRYILKKLEQVKRVHILDLSTELGVSDDTIRRDLAEMDIAGTIRKVHGGAVARSSGPHGYHERESIGLKEKALLAEKAIPYLREGQVVIFDGGTTNIEVAKRIPTDMHLTVITNSVPLAEILCDHPTADIILMGGKVFKASQVTVGSDVYSALQNIRADLYIMGVCAVSKESGITFPDREEALIKKEMVARSKQVLVLATPGKMENTEPYKACDFENAELIVLD